MMPMRIKETAQQRADEAFVRTYRDEICYLNRAARRTAAGRQKVAEARAKALQVKVEVLEAELAGLKGGAA